MLDIPSILQVFKNSMNRVDLEEEIDLEKENCKSLGLLVIYFITHLFLIMLSVFEAHQSKFLCLQDLILFDFIWAIIGFFDLLLLFNYFLIVN